MFSSSIATNSLKVEISRLNNFSAKTNSSFFLLYSATSSLYLINYSNPSFKSTSGDPGPAYLYSAYTDFRPYLKSATYA